MYAILPTNTWINLFVLVGASIALSLMVEGVRIEETYPIWISYRTSGIHVFRTINLAVEWYEDAYEAKVNVVHTGYGMAELHIHFEDGTQLTIPFTQHSLHI